MDPFVGTKSNIVSYMILPFFLSIRYRQKSGMRNGKLLRLARHCEMVTSLARVLPRVPSRRRRRRKNKCYRNLCRMHQLRPTGNLLRALICLFLIIMSRQVRQCPEMPRIQVMSSRFRVCLLYTSPSPRDKRQSRMPSSA